MANDAADLENPSYTLQGSSETLLPIQLFQFKTHLLETVEELRMGRIAQVQYEEQINKILMEKQELMWKYESLSKQEEIVEKKHSDSLSALKKQLQAKMCLIEEEKGQFQLAAEAKERENISLREDLKALQLWRRHREEISTWLSKLLYQNPSIAKYNVQKNVHETEQKLQLHILAKEEHIKQVSECKKCIGNVTQQFGMIKEVHETLKQTVQTAIQNNKKLNADITQKQNEIEHLKEELKKLSSELLKYKVTCKQRADEENIGLSEKEQQVRELRERLQTETEISKKLMEENTSMREGKQEDIKALSNMRNIVQRHAQTIMSLENQLSVLTEDYKTLERDNELQRAKATENEEKFLALRSEHERAFAEWKVQKESLAIERDTVKKAMESMKEAEENQSGYNMDIAVYDTENKTSENGPQNDPAANTTTSYIVSSNDISLPVTTNGIQKMDGSKGEVVYKDANSLHNVYSMADKGHVGEEQKDESALTQNKDGFSSNVKDFSDGKCTEEIPDDRTCMNEDEESAADRRRTAQTPAMVLPDNNKPPAVCREDASEQTDSSHHKSADGTSKEVYIVLDKPDRTDNDRGVLINETCSEESQRLDQTVGELINDQGPDRDSPSVGPGDGGNYYLPVLSKDTSEISTKSYSHEQIQQSKVKPMETTNENPPGEGAEQTRRIEPKLVESKDTERTSGICRIERTETFSKCLGPETVFTTSYPLGNAGLQSDLDPSCGDCNIASLQYTENLYTHENCPMDNAKDSIVEETSEGDVNVESDLYSENHCEQTHHTSEPAEADEEKVCSQEGDNMAAVCMSQVVSSDGRTKVAPIKEEMSKTNGKSPTNLPSLKKCIYLPGSQSKDSLSVLLANQTNHVLSRLPSQDLDSRPEQVPRKDHSAERNAEPASHNSSIPLLANTSENSDVAEKRNPGPAISDATRSFLINRPNNGYIEVNGGSNKENYDSSSIQRQISAIERFLFTNKLNGSRKRKLEE